MDLSPHKERIKEQFEALAPDRRAWKRKNRYYYERQREYLRFLVPPGKRVLELGCGTGELLAALEPEYGVGVDFSENMLALASEAYPELNFIVADAEEPETWGISPGGKDGEFDVVVISDTIGHMEDIQAAFEKLRPFCTQETRLIVTYYSFLWEPALKLAERAGLKMPQRMNNWLSPLDIENILFLADFETVKTDRRLLMPVKVPLFHRLFEFIEALPGLNRLCLANYVVARMKRREAVAGKKNVSVIVPCRNERGNIEPAVDRTPDMGAHTEIVFVDGHSEDGTQDEIRRVMEARPDRDVKFLVQDGKGKGDAVRKGFAEASGEVLMILDADLTVPPEDLPKFYRAIAAGKGEFINGTRLVYPMEDQAMRFLNLLGNKFFSLAFTWLLNQRLKDTLCGTKVISRHNYERLAAGRAYFGDFDPFGDFDLLFGASKLNLKIVEVPIRYRAREYGETQISRFRHGWLLLRMTAFAMRKLKLV
jgi:ubiquinone/menaquinone biosynthesis C-methylase UbiE